MLSHPDVWITGLILAAVLAIFVRPAVVAVCLLPTRLTRNERIFIMLAGLKGAVPVLLGAFLSRRMFLKQTASTGSWLSSWSSPSLSRAASFQLLSGVSDSAGKARKTKRS